MSLELPLSPAEVKSGLSTKCCRCCNSLCKVWMWASKSCCAIFWSKNL